MTTPRHQLLQQLTCGDRSLHDPEIQHHLAADPLWRQEVEELLALRDRLGKLNRASQGLAARALELRHPGDLRRVQSALRARRRLPRLALAALFLLPLLPLALLLPPGAPAAAAATPRDGQLGTQAALRLISSASNWQLHCDAPLPPGASHRLVMLAPDGRMLEAEPEDFPWQLPAEWQQLAAAAGAVQFELSSCEPGGIPQLHRLDWSQR